MGVDLKLFPIDHLEETSTPEGSTSWGFSHTILPLQRDYGLWDAIKTIEGRLVPPGVSAFTGQRLPDGKCKDERTYGDLSTDPYGDPYRMVRAGDLAPVLTEHQPGPAAAFIAACKPDRWIVLEWH